MDSKGCIASQGCKEKSRREDGNGIVVVVRKRTMMVVMIVGEEMGIFFMFL